MIRRPPRSTQSRSSAASDVYKRQDRSGNVVHQGLAVYGHKGVTDQHAYVQQLIEGRDDSFVTFVLAGFGEESTAAGFPTLADHLFANFEGTRDTLSACGRDSVTISVPDAGPTALGALVALFERAVGLYAELIDVNAYHQPSVNKDVAAPVLALQSAAVGYLGEDRGGDVLVHARLVVRVHVDQLGVQANRALEQRDQRPQRGRPSVRDADRDGVAAAGAQCVPGALEVGEQVVSQGREARGCALLTEAGQHKRDERVIAALDELLDICVLIGNSLVAVDGQPLVNAVAGTVEPLAEGLHYELLDIAWEAGQPVPVGQQDHRLAAAPTAQPVPRQRERHRGVKPRVAAAGELVHVRRAAQEVADRYSLESGRKQAHRGGDRSTPAHPCLL